MHVFVLEGEIAAGKSVALRVFEEAMRHMLNPVTQQPYVVTAVQEPVDKWREHGALERFMADPKKEALFFQSYVFTTRIAAILQALARHPRTEVLLLERSVLADRYLFMQGLRHLVLPQEMAMYREMWNLHVPLLASAGVHVQDPTRTTFVYLKPRLELCMQRLQRRGRHEETAKVSGVQIEYQRSLRKAHEVLFQGAEPEPGMERPTFPLHVHILEGETVDHDYSIPGEARDALMRVFQQIVARQR